MLAFREKWNIVKRDGIRKGTKERWREINGDGFMRERERIKIVTERLNKRDGIKSYKEKKNP